MLKAAMNQFNAVTLQSSAGALIKEAERFQVIEQQIVQLLNAREPVKVPQLLN